MSRLVLIVLALLWAAPLPAAPPRTPAVICLCKYTPSQQKVIYAAWQKEYQRRVYTYWTLRRRACLYPIPYPMPYPYRMATPAPSPPTYISPPAASGSDPAVIALLASMSANAGRTDPALLASFQALVSQNAQLVAAQTQLVAWMMANGTAKSSPTPIVIPAPAAPAPAPIVISPPPTPITPTPPGHVVIVGPTTPALPAAPMTAPGLPAAPMTVPALPAAPMTAPALPAAPGTLPGLPPAIPGMPFTPTAPAPKTKESRTPGLPATYYTPPAGLRRYTVAPRSPYYR